MVSVALSRMFVSGVLLILFAPVLQLSPKRSPEAIADDLLKSPLTAAVTERRRKIFHFEMLREPQDVTLPKSRLRLALKPPENLQLLLSRTLLNGASADPHVRWCGGCRQHWRWLPDLCLLRGPGLVDTVEFTLLCVGQNSGS